MKIRLTVEKASTLNFAFILSYFLLGLALSGQEINLGYDRFILTNTESTPAANESTHQSSNRRIEVSLKEIYLLPELSGIPQGEPITLLRLKDEYVGDTKFEKFVHNFTRTIDAIDGMYYNSYYVFRLGVFNSVDGKPDLMTHITGRGSRVRTVNNLGKNGISMKISPLNLGRRRIGQEVTIEFEIAEIYEHKRTKERTINRRNTLATSTFHVEADKQNATVGILINDNGFALEVIWE